LGHVWHVRVFFPYPAEVLWQSVTGIAILGLLHSSNVFSQVINLCLESSFPWWGFLFCMWFGCFLSILAVDNLTVATAAA
jgi:hypothetical protein